ncbi:alpha/beta-hydrolase [Piromyces finnis]|uniref:Carboxylic ester hydrolase n=1 Tax=Piromyces finnis TaxID=1754191 RepID=A0A1Y1VIZ4_9FUNG|nr:alpha/beta-hydrolase [Piromyces finnis]|eukprot:ORX57690.1 alpha/beta-hydrolase [Piromyces finnis]
MREWKCESGTFSGYETENCIHISGIRYANSERYGKPVPYKYNENVYECKSSPFGIQLHSVMENYISGVEFEKMEQEENCQYLSITMPKNINKESKLPVMVFIHGGSYKNGGCDLKYYDREPMVKENQIIHVGINYRLGVFGFLRDKNGNMSNNGLFDIIEGLKWIKKNISSFGGNSNNITIYGQSAGGDAVRCVMLSKGTEQLYQRAIIQSDPIGTMYNRENMENKMLEELNQLPIDATIEQLKECQASIAKNITEKGNPKYMIFAPHFGIDPLPKIEDIPKRLQEIAPSHPLFIGNTSREVALFISSNKLIRGLSSIFLTSWAIEGIIKRISNSIYHNPTSIFAKQYADAGGKTYRYVFSWGENDSFVGAAHMSELSLLFGGSEVVGRDMGMGLTEEEIYKQGKPIRELWSSFAKTGNFKTMKIDGVIEIQKL